MSDAKQFAKSVILDLSDDTPEQIKSELEKMKNEGYFLESSISVERGIGVKHDSILLTFDRKTMDKKIRDFDCKEFCFLGRQEDAAYKDEILNTWNKKGYEKLTEINAKRDRVSCQYFIAVRYEN